MVYCLPAPVFYGVKQEWVIRLHHILETLQGSNLDDIASGLGFEHTFFAGEWIDTLACFSCGFSFDFDLAQTGDGEYARAVLFQIILDHGGEAIKDFRDFFFAHAGIFGEVGKDISFRSCFFYLCELVAFGRFSFGGRPSCGFPCSGRGLRFFLSSHCRIPSLLPTTTVALGCVADALGSHGASRVVTCVTIGVFFRESHGLSSAVQILMSPAQTRPVASLYPLIYCKTRHFHVSTVK